MLVQSRVEQTYLSVIKTLSIASGQFLPQRDMVFAPACGAEVMQVMARLLSETQAQPPKLVLDGSASGRALAADMGKSAHLVVLPGLAGREDCTVEDLFPAADLATQLDRVERRPERLFADVVVEGQPFVAQAQAWAQAEGIALPGDWRLQLAERIRHKMLEAGPARLTDATRTRWRKFLERLATD
ncbi:MAG: hypothetical protein LAT78_06915 [Roseinatronobacter sp.]|nr:hypothetical protein [Roseinatronobacter sp.]